MAQTTGAEARAGYKIEASVNGSSWTDISGQSNSVTVDGGEQIVGEQNTADGQAPVVTGSNKVGSSTVTVSSLYTETAAESWRVVRDRYIGTDKTIFLRYCPKGGASAERRYVCANDANTAVAVPIVNCSLPAGDANSGDPLMFEFSVRAPRLFEEAVP